MTDKHANVPNVNQFNDHRGALLALNFPQLPFTPRRVFVVTDTPEGMVRGKHAHHKTRQILVCLTGCITLRLENEAKGPHTVVLYRGDSLIHEALEWAELEFTCANSVLLSACSTDFDPSDYIGTYRIVSYRIVSYRIVSYRIVSYRNVSYRIVSYRIVSYRIVSYRIASYRIVSYRIISHRRALVVLVLVRIKHALAAQYWCAHNSCAQY
jgi:hypothetical protein